MNRKIFQVIAIVIAVIIVGFFITQNKPQINPNPQPTDDTNNSLDTAPKQTYISDKLGISFDYLPDQDGDGQPDTAVAEADDKLYVYYSAAAPENGQWVQKFTKNPNDTLVQAIQKQFLQNYSSKDCYAIDFVDFYTSMNFEPPTIPDNISEAIIAYPKPTDPNAPFFENSSKCPATYSFTNGLSYFYMDKNHPDKYYFFSIGQYAIIADLNGPKAWQDTVLVR
jgi:hypothetical protein